MKRLRAWLTSMLRNEEVHLYLVVFLVLLLLSFVSARRADASELWVEAGATVVRYEAPVIGVAIAWPRVGPIDTDYLLGLHLIGAAGDMENQSALTLGIVDGLGRFDIGLGLCLLHHEDERNGSRANFWLYVAYRFKGNRDAVRQRHCSNAGQTENNKGLDFSTYARRLGP